MISTYRLFQIIFGIIVSAFVLYFLIQYAVSYQAIEQDSQKLTIMRNVKETTSRVYSTGNPINYKHGTRYDLSSCRVKLINPLSIETPSIRCDFGSISIFIPTLLYMGNNVFISRKTLDYGWWETHFIEVVPETHFIFNPLENTDDVWGLMENITKYLPDTSLGFEPRITFGFCDGSDVLEDLCGGLCEAQDFLNVLKQPHSTTTFALCSGVPDGSYSRLITISSACSPYLPNSGICISPPGSEGVGSVYIKGHTGEFIYKDPADLVALIIGGTEEDPFGVPYGKELYEYKNQVFGTMLLNAVEIMSQRSILIAGDLPSECQPLLSDFAHNLDSLNTLIMEYNDRASMINMNSKLELLSSQYQNLVNIGCEYV